MMDISPDDRLAASVFEVGVLLGFVRREDVVRWADRRIEAVAAPPPWLIDLSLSQVLHDTDLVALLRRVAAGADPVKTCAALYALHPRVEGLTFDEAEKVANRLYRITLECLGGDWTIPWVAETDHIDDTFGYVRDGYVDTTRDEAVRQLHDFIERHRDDEVVRLLYPVAWSDPPR